MISLVYHYYIKLDFSLNISINKFIIWFEVLSVRGTKMRAGAASEERCPPALIFSSFSLCFSFFFRIKLKSLRLFCIEYGLMHRTNSPKSAIFDLGEIWQIPIDHQWGCRESKRAVYFPKNSQKTPACFSAGKKNSHSFSHPEC